MLDTILDEIATYKERIESIKGKIKKALYYPAAVVAVAIIVSAILLIFVIPQFEDIFASFGAALPASLVGPVALGGYGVSYLGLARWLGLGGLGDWLGRAG